LVTYSQFVLLQLVLRPSLTLLATIFKLSNKKRSFNPKKR
jgi:hypothetical protein